MREVHEREPGLGVDAEPVGAPVRPLGIGELAAQAMEIGDESEGGAGVAGIERHELVAGACRVGRRPCPVAAQEGDLDGVHPAEPGVHQPVVELGAPSIGGHAPLLGASQVGDRIASRHRVAEHPPDEQGVELAVDDGDHGLVEASHPGLPISERDQRSPFGLECHRPQIGVVGRAFPSTSGVAEGRSLIAARCGTVGVGDVQPAPEHVVVGSVDVPSAPLEPAEGGSLFAHQPVVEEQAPGGRCGLVIGSVVDVDTVGVAPDLDRATRVVGPEVGVREQVERGAVERGRVDARQAVADVAPTIRRSVNRRSPCCDRTGAGRGDARTVRCCA